MRFKKPTYLSTLLPNCQENTSMSVTRLILIFLSFCFMSVCHATEHEFKNADEKTIFRNFTLAVCLSTAYQSDSQKLTNDANKAAGAYSQFGHMGFQAYEDATVLIDSWLKKDYQSKSGGQIEIMKCIDLYNSKELAEFFQKYDPCKNPDQWLDKEEYKNRCK